MNESSKLIDHPELEPAYSFSKKKSTDLDSRKSVKIAKESKQQIIKLLEELCPKAIPIN